MRAVKKPPAEYRLHVLPQGRTLRANSRKTLLQAVLAGGIPAPHSCILGYCGSCRAKLRSGVVEYPSGQVIDMAMDATPPDEIMLCLARPRSDVEVEIRFPALSP